MGIPGSRCLLLHLVVYLEYEMLQPYLLANLQTVFELKSYTDLIKWIPNVRKSADVGWILFFVSLLSCADVVSQLASTGQLLRARARTF